MEKDRNLLIFRRTPIDVDFKMFEQFAKNFWNGKVTVYAESAVKDYRAVCGYPEETQGIRTVLPDRDGIAIDDAFFAEHQNDIFVFNGFHYAKPYLKYLKKYRPCFGFLTERSIRLMCGNSAKDRLHRLFPFELYWKNHFLIRHCSFCLTFGESGVECFRKYFCFKSEKLFDFMYNDGNQPLPPKPYRQGNPVRFAYVGRLDYHIKGVDVLLDAFRNLPGNYTLDLVGGYGNDAEEIRQKVASMEKVNCIGIWKNDDVCQNLNGYDVILVPSRMDGWNLHCNIAVNAGIGVIATDQTGSEEIVRHCGNGMLVSAGDPAALREAVESVLARPEIINEWKEKTVGYAPRISADRVAEYLADVLQYACKETAERPNCPW